MTIHIGSRIFYPLLTVTIIYLFLGDPEDPRTIQRFTSFLFLGLGVLGLFIHWQLNFSWKGNLSWKGREFSAEDFHGFRRRIESLLIAGLILGMGLGFIIHFVSITYGFRDAFFLGEKDFTSMGEVILNIYYQGNYHSPFHGEGQSSYLSHHFSPGIIVYLPFLVGFSDRIALAWGQLFFTILIYVLILFFLRRILPDASGSFTVSYGKKIHPLKFLFLGFLLFLANIYIYRISLSYHFEILFVLFFLLLIFVRQKHPNTGNPSQSPSRYSLSATIGEILLLLLILSVKEDTAVYLGIYYLGEAIYFFFRKNQRYLRNLFLGLGMGVYFFLLLPGLREVMGVSAEENWMAIWNLPGDYAGFVESWDRIVSRGAVLWEISVGFGFLFLLAPRYFFYLLVVAGIHFLSEREWHNSFYNYYIYTILPVLIAGSLEGLGKILRISSAKTALPIFYIILAFCFYRNSWDKNFPFTHSQLPGSVPNELSSNRGNLSPEERSQGFKKRSWEIEILRLELEKNSHNTGTRQLTVATQFDMGVYVPIRNRLYPIQENPTLPNGNKPNLILLNTRSGFSPYIPLTEIKAWRENWIQNHSYRPLREIGDFQILSLEELK